MQREITEIQAKIQEYYEMVDNDFVHPTPNDGFVHALEVEVGDRTDREFEEGEDDEYDYGYQSGEQWLEGDIDEFDYED